MLQTPAGAGLVRAEDAAALGAGKVVTQAALGVVAFVRGAGSGSRASGRRRGGGGGGGAGGRRATARAAAASAGTSPCRHVVVDREESMRHEPRVNRTQVRLAQEVVLAQVRVRVQPLLHLGERQLRHFGKIGFSVTS